jgi:tight adherence protein C
MSRGLVLSAIVAWGGATLVLAEMRWFRRPELTDRLARYTPGVTRRGRRPGALSAGSFREVIAPLASSAGDRLSRMVGVTEALDTRLVRIHAPMDVTAFRLRELGVCLGALSAASVLTVLVRPPATIAVLFLLGAPALAFLVLENQVARASARWQRRIFAELPIVTEQLGMLLGAGFSLGGALNRIAHRGSGACATDLTRVCGRIRQGLGESTALHEWAGLARVDALDRLVAVLALNREAADLSRLITEEARSIRRDAQRELTETIERRAQQVWIPVTVATLVPGVLFMVVPFVQALRLFTTS